MFLWTLEKEGLASSTWNQRDIPLWSHGGNTGSNPVCVTNNRHNVVGNWFEKIRRERQ